MKQAVSAEKEVRVNRTRRLVMVCLGLLAPLAPLAPLALEAQGRSVAQLAGRVIDSVHARPLAGATVLAMGLSTDPPTFHRVIADDRGRFHFDSLAAGRYALSFSHPLVDSMELLLPDRIVAVGIGEERSLDLALPSGITLRESACPGARLDRGRGAVLGMVTDAATERPFAGATVVVSWTDLRVDPRTLRPVQQARTGAVVTDAFGEYRICGVPTDNWLELQVQHGQAASGVLQLSVNDTTGVVRRNFSVSLDTARAASVRTAATSAAGSNAGSDAGGDAFDVPTTGTATLVGRVLDQAGRPLPEAQVRLSNSRAVGRTDAEGHFTLSGLPAGTQTLEARRIGYSVGQVAVDLRNGTTITRELRLTRQVLLDTVLVTAKQVKYPEFERNRRGGAGRYLDEDEIARRAPYRTSELLRFMPGFRLVRNGFDDIVASSRTHNGICAANIVIDHWQHRAITEVSPGDIARLESYATEAEAPPQYDATCGVIVIWTKR
jgi:hypothetical protein